MRSIIGMLVGAFLGALLGTAITAVFVYSQTHNPNPRDPQKGWASPIVGLVVIPFCTVVGAFKGAGISDNPRDDD